MRSVNPYEDKEISEKLDKLREEVLKLERELGKYGYDPRRGIESYSISELKDMIKKAGSEHAKVRDLLAKLVETQKKLYRELYNAAGLRELNVDTETPEKNLLKIEEWLLMSRENLVNHDITKFEKILGEIAKILGNCQENCETEILGVLRKVYKRDYDRYRVIKYVIETCGRLGIYEEKEIETLSLKDAVNLIVRCAKKVGPTKLAIYIISQHR